MNIKSKLIELINTFFPTLGTKLLYKSSFGYYPNLSKPRTINEKLQVLKLNEYYKNDIITNCCDKFKVREYLNKEGFGECLPKLYGVYKKASEIDWETLPNSFVIKCNHGSGYNIIVDDKTKINYDSCVKRLNNWMNEDYWKRYAEVQYKYIDKRIIIEEYLGDNIPTLKFYCFNGDPKFFYIATDYIENGDSEYIDFYDFNYNHLDITLRGHDNNPIKQKKIENINKCISVAKILSRPFPFVRVDLYSVRNKVFFSEFTFIPTGGYMKLEPLGTDVKLGELLNL